MIWMITRGAIIAILAILAILATAIAIMATLTHDVGVRTSRPSLWLRYWTCHFRVGVHTYVCKYIYIYICICVCTHIYIYICVWHWSSLWIAEARVCTACLRAVCLYVYVHVYMYIYIYICNTCMWSRVARGKSSPTGVAVRCYSQWRWGVTCVSEDVSHETSDVTPVAPHRRCHCFEHVSREMPDVTPCHASPPQGVPRSRASRRKLSHMRSRV